MEKADLRKAAIVLASLGHEVAAEVCRQMNEADAEVLLDEVAKLGTVAPEEQREALSAFRQHLGAARLLGGPTMAEQLMAAVLGPKRSRRRNPKQQSALGRLHALSSDPAAVHRLLKAEAPPMVALVLAQLSPENAAQALEAWPKEERGELAWRMATLGQLAPGAVEAIAEALADRSYLVDNDATANAGVGFVVKLLEDMDRGTTKELLEELRARDEALAAQVEEQLFTFEDVLRLPERAFQLVLRGIEHPTIARALKGAEAEMTQRVLSNLSTRGQEILKQEMDLLGPVLLSEVEAAQKEFVRKALELEESGELTLSAQKEVYVE